MSPPGFRGKFARPFRRLTAAGALALVCVAPAQAEDGGFHPLDSLLRTMQLKTDVGPVPGFVEASRPKDTDFVSVGQPHPQGSIKVKTPVELKAAEASLDAARMRHDQISGRKPPDTKTSAGKKAAAAGPPRPATQN